VPIGALSSYRAWVQIKGLTLSTTSPVLRPGVVVQANLASWARVESDARIELVQGARVAMLGEVYLPRNHEPVFDPRPKVGRPQWLRVPPPTIREQPVSIER
jgi:hypothetical protein